jgi:hypothetical protein
MRHVFDGDFWKMIMNGVSVYRRQVIWQQEGSYGIFLSPFFVTVPPLILCVFGSISETRSVMICDIDSRHKTFAITPLWRTSTILVFF